MHIEGDDKEAWEDVEEDGRLPHLIPLQDRSCLTLVHTNGVHFCNIQYCSCDGLEESAAHDGRAAPCNNEESQDHFYLPDAG